MKQQWITGAVLVFVSQAALASAEPQTPTVIQFDGQTYLGFRDARGALAMNGLAEYSLTREAALREPHCEMLDAFYAAQWPRIERCLNGTSSERACASLHEVNETYRTNDGFPSNLLQSWLARPETPAPIGDGARRALAQAMSLAPGQIRDVGRLEVQGPATRVFTSVNGDGMSWASRLNGYLDLGSTLVELNPRNPLRFETSDQLIACGIMAGDVSVLGEQPVLISDGHAAPLSAAELIRIHRALEARGALPEMSDLDPLLWNALAVGARIGVTLTELGLDEHDLEAKVRHVIETLYDEDFALRTGLTEAELAPAGATIEALIPFRARIEQED